MFVLLLFRFVVTECVLVHLFALKKMVQITEDLIRRRSEHNDGMLSNLKEITLHQFELENIGPVLHQLCRELQIIYLQNNLISKIENLHHLKDLRYLNMAVNNVTWIENLEQNEMLEKLDLTVNCVEDLICVENLKSNVNLRELFAFEFCILQTVTNFCCRFLLGNPCANIEGYRLFIIETLPQLHSLDGEDITKTERLKAKQEYSRIRAIVEKNSYELKTKERKPEIVYNENGERLYGNDPESRKAAYAELNKKRDEAPKVQRDASKIGELEDINKFKKQNELTPEQQIEKFGRVMQRNEPKWEFKLLDDEENTILDIAVGKFMPTSAIQVDVQPTYIRVEAKGKVLQLAFTEEVKASLANAQRSKTTGNLKITIPKAKNEISVL